MSFNKDASIKLILGATYTWKGAPFYDGGSEGNRARPGQNPDVLLEKSSPQIWKNKSKMKLCKIFKSMV